VEAGKEMVFCSQSQNRNSSQDKNHYSRQIETVRLPAHEKAQSFRPSTPTSVSSPSQTVENPIAEVSAEYKDLSQIGRTMNPLKNNLALLSKEGDPS